MDSDAMVPFGRALKAYHDGRTDAAVIMRREDGFEVPMPVEAFFQGEANFTIFEANAVQLCRGTVLDIGAGTGKLSLAVQKHGCAVTAIDISPEAVDVMRKRGLTNVSCVDAFAYHGGPFDTILLMGHGIGMVESLSGLGAFLAHVRTLIAGDGQLILDSLDVRRTRDPRHLAYHEMKRRAGAYEGEIRVQLAFEEMTGPFCGWLQVDPDLLKRYSETGGWRCSVLMANDGGEYLAKLTP